MIVSRQMKKVIITGATGMVGGIILRECLDSSDIETVISLSRKPTGISHPKLQEVIHADFLDYTGLESHFKEVDIAHFCIGVYTGQVPDAKFKEITVDVTAAFAEMLFSNSPQATFCFLSGAGADPQEKSRMSFARYKGMAENHLIKRGFGRLFIFRPAYIYPVQKRKEPNITYRISRWLYPVLKSVMSTSVIPSETLGKAMFQAGITGAATTVLENEAIKNIEI